MTMNNESEQGESFTVETATGATETFSSNPVAGEAVAAADEAVVEAEATTSTEDFVPRAELDAIKAQLDEVAAWRAQQQAALQQAQQAQQVEQEKAVYQSLEQKWEAMGVDPGEAPILTASVMTLKAAREAGFSPEEAQQVLKMMGNPQVMQRFDAMQRRDHSLQQLRDSLPTNTSVATLWKLMDEISAYATPGERTLAAKHIAERQKMANQRQRAENGAEVVERGGGNANVYGTPRDRYLKALKEGRRKDFSPQEIDRLTAGYLNG